MVKRYKSRFSSKRRSYSKKRGYKRSSYKKFTRRTGFKLKKGYGSRRRFFRKSAPTVSGVLARQEKRVPKIPRSLFVDSASAISLLGKVGLISCDYFVNARNFDVTEFDHDELQSSGTGEHHKQIAALNPIHVFTRPAVDFGLSPSASNPTLNHKYTKISFSGQNNDLLTMMSIYDPATISYNSMFFLDEVINSKVVDLNVKIRAVLSGIPIILFNTVAGTINFQVLPVDFVLLPDGINIVGGIMGTNQTRTYLRSFTFLLKVINYFIAEFSQISRAHNKYSNVLTYDVDSRVLNIMEIPVIPDNVIGANAVYTLYAQGFINKKITQPGVVACTASVAHGSNYPQDVIMTMNPFARYMIAFNSVGDEILPVLFSFFASLFARSYYMPIANVNTPVSETAIGKYVLTMYQPTVFTLDELQTVKKLSTLKVISFKQFSSKQSMRYYPKSEPNAHFLIMPASTNCKLTTVYSRDYSDFMAVFRNSVRSKTMRNNLSVAGINLLDRLEPAFKLNAIINN